MAITHRNKSPEFLADLREHTIDIIESQTTLSREEVVSLADKVADRMRQNWGGTQIYFPKGASRSALDRKRKIYDDFDGTNHNELARKHQVSLTIV
jgi:Mor family transcriptional regulator